jgi:heptosyltransferase-3
MSSSPAQRPSGGCADPSRSAPGRGGWNLAGRTDLAGLIGVIARADAVAVGNTGPAHLAAAVGTPVVSIFPPTVPAAAWAPWRVPNVILGDQDAACAGCRARVCPLPDMPCVSGVTPAMVVEAVGLLTDGAHEPNLAVVS